MATSNSVSVIRIKPNHYIHVVDNNTNVTRVEIGPKTFSRLDHERVLNANPEPMLMIPPRHYAIIDNPSIRDPVTKKPQVDQYGQVRLRHGDQEIRYDPLFHHIYLFFHLFLGYIIYMFLFFFFFSFVFLFCFVLLFCLVMFY